MKIEKLFIFNKKIIKILYEEYKKFYKSQISLKSFYIIVSPFIFTFLDIIRYKYKIINNCKKKNKNYLFSTLHKKNFDEIENFSDFLSKVQTDKFNLQLNTEIILYKKFNNNTLYLKRNFKKIFIKFFKKNINLKNLELKEKNLNAKINSKSYFYKLDFRHKDIINKLVKKNKNYENLNDNKIFSFKLLNIPINSKLRNNILSNLNSLDSEEKFYFKMLVKYLPSIYLEGIDENLKNVQNITQVFPKNIISNAHGWWGNDYFKFYLAACIKNKTKYFEVQHNGTYFVFDNNVHFDISSLFRDKFIGWGLACKGFKNSLNLPSLYTVNKNEKKKINGNKIVLMSANISRFFEGYRNSYLSGGFNLHYFQNQIVFLEKLNQNICKNVVIRSRFNIKDPNDYITFLKKKFKKLHIEEIKNSAYARLKNSKFKIIVVDHCSTPWLEALFINKPLIMFWDKKLNILSKKYSKIFDELEKNKILFYSPSDAASRLNNIANKEINWWYSNKIQNLRKKILKLFMSYETNSFYKWDKKLKYLLYK